MKLVALLPQSVRSVVESHPQMPELLEVCAAGSCCRVRRSIFNCLTLLAAVKRAASDQHTGHRSQLAHIVTRSRSEWSDAAWQPQQQP